MDDDSRLDERLGSSAPTHAGVGMVDDEVFDALIRDAQAEARRRGRRRRRTTAIGIVAGIVAIGIPATAVAATQGWLPGSGIKEPLTQISYTLPSGGTCTEDIGDLLIPGDPALQKKTQDQLRTHGNEILSKGKIDAEIAKLRKGEDYWVRNGLDGNGNSATDQNVRVGYGTPYYDADYEYDRAVWELISAALPQPGKGSGSARLAYPDGASTGTLLGTSTSVVLATEFMRWGGYTQCTGPDPRPDIPWWEKQGAQ